ncbi:isoamylase early set domain-containing protein [Vibrio maerlii]|uniref:isoamylase early set domain-containing protein n=1 Tax=Vibrio maerlii TaxID=2231648 RepID=UPI000E3E3283|nr:isoamylase early set domain-containing protein [Vibrio maerlii]
MFKKRFFKTKDEVEVTFQWTKEDDISSVAICGDFSDWQPVAMKLNRQKVFTYKTRLAKDSSFQFRYLINEETWENDHQADDYVWNGLGSDNSVVTTFEEVTA